MEIFTAYLTIKVVFITALFFGFAPALAIRIITVMWPRGDPRRNELRAQLYSLEYWKRPLWVAEQLETALFDGLPCRARRLGCWPKQTHAASRALQGELWNAGAWIRESTGVDGLQLCAYTVRRRLTPPFTRVLIPVSTSGAKLVKPVRIRKGKGLAGQCWVQAEIGEVPTIPTLLVDHWERHREGDTGVSIAAVPLLDEFDQFVGCVTVGALFLRPITRLSYDEVVSCVVSKADELARAVQQSRSRRRWS